MGVKLMVEVLDHAPDDWTPPERLLVVAIAEQANDLTRQAFCGPELIAHRAKLADVKSVARSLRRLAERGYELRVPAGTDANGKVLFAYRGHRTVYAVPRLCPNPTHETHACLERVASARASNDTEPEERVAAGATQSGGKGGAESHPKEADQPEKGWQQEPPNPAVGEEKGWQSEPERVAVRDAKGGTRGHPSPQSPQSPQGGVGGETPASLPPPAAQPSAGRHSQPSLIPLHSVKLPAAVDLIYRWGLWNGYDDTTPDEAREVHRAFRHRYGSKPLSYLEAMASANGGGFYDFYQEVRSRRAAETKDALERLVETEPECEHGSAAGRAVHPMTGQMLCALCRAGRAPKPDSGPTTPADVAGAMDAYHGAYRAAHGSAPKTDWLLRISHEAAALAARGLPADQLADIAARAGRVGADLFTAATERTVA